MFESVAPEAFRRQPRRLFYEVLPLSIAVHVFAVAGAVLSTVWTVVFPLESPRLVRAYSLATIPDPPPPPPPPAAAPAPKPVAPPAPPPPIEAVVAPTIIPDIIPQVPDPPPPAEPVAPVADTAPAVADGAADGQPGGTPGGVAQGVPGGIPFPDDGRVHVERGKDLPVEIVLQEFPRYPSDALRKGLEDQVVVRYIIGKNGRVIDVQILSHASFASFDTAAVEAIRQWRFRPMIKNGKPVEVEHDLAVNFVLVRR